MGKYDSNEFSDFFSEKQNSNSNRVARTNSNRPSNARPVSSQANSNRRGSSEAAMIRKKLRKSKKTGLIMTFIQLLLSISFMGIFYPVRENVLDSLVTTPMYIGIGVALFILFLIPFIMQFKGLIVKRVGKVISVFMIFVLIVGLYFVIPMMQLKISGNGTKKVSSDKPFVIYLSGNDTFDAIPTNSNGRSDTNIVAVVNPKTYTALLVTTPRDAYVELVADDLPAGNYDKLTHAGVLGTGKKDKDGNWGHGCDVSMNVLSNLYDIEINNYLRLNFTGFSKLVDAMGGVTIDIPQGFSTYTYGKHYTFEEGEQTLNGDEALTYVRERHSFANGDIQRGANQVAVIQALLDQGLSANLITNYSEILDSIDKSFESDMDVSSLAKLQLDLQGEDDYNGWNIVSYAVTGTPGREYSYLEGASRSIVYLDDQSVDIAKQMMHMVLDGKKVTKKTADKLKNKAEGSTDDNQ